jgi:hypothetical protein
MESNNDSDSSNDSIDVYNPASTTPGKTNVQADLWKSRFEESEIKIEKQTLRITELGGTIKQLKLDRSLLSATNSNMSKENTKLKSELEKRKLAQQSTEKGNDDEFNAYKLEMSNKINALNQEKEYLLQEIDNLKQTMDIHTSNYESQILSLNNELAMKTGNKYHY